MDIPPGDEAWLASQVDEAIAPYVGKLAAPDLAWMRAQLLDRLRTDRSLALLAHRAQPRAVDESTELYYGRSAPEDLAAGEGSPPGSRRPPNR